MTAPSPRQHQPHAQARAPLTRHSRDGLVGLPAEAANEPAPPVKQRAPTWLDMEQPWRAADAAYLAHWGQCPTCKAAAAGHSPRCATGQHLHHTYLAALAKT